MGRAQETAWPSFAQITKSRTYTSDFLLQMSKRPLLVRLDFNGPDEPKNRSHCIAQRQNEQIVSSATRHALVTRGKSLLELWVPTFIPD